MYKGPTAGPPNLSQLSLVSADNCDEFTWAGPTPTNLPQQLPLSGNNCDVFGD